MRPKVRFTKTLRPIISKEQLDDEANCFLTMYCPQALEEPMAVPIKEIILEKMGLELVEDKCLTSDFSLIGAMCFSGESVTVYNEEAKSYEEMPLNKPTIIVDKNTCANRNMGAFNNTLAHEAYHWFRHRLYAMAKNEQGQDRVVIHRCSCSASETRPKKYSEDIEFIEWQANSVAPKILMPKATTVIKIADLMEKYEYTSEQDDSAEKLKQIIMDLAEFFAVSKQAAKIRMIDLGYNEASGVYNYDQTKGYQISIEDALRLGLENSDFSAAIDSNSFAYINGYFVAKNKKYLYYDDESNLQLTEYAIKNIPECCLQFQYNFLSTSNENANCTNVLYRQSIECAASSVLYNKSDQNDEIDAIDVQIEKFDKNYKELRLYNKTANEMIVELMRDRKWQSAIFCEKTLLEPMTYTRIINNAEHKFKPETLMAICAGLEIDYSLTEQILKASGHGFGITKQQQAYAWIFRVASHVSIYEKNKFLKRLGYEPLGSKQRK